MSSQLNAEAFSPDIREFLRLLALVKAEYLIVGGEAVIFHGFARFTGDVDFFVSDTPENAQRIFDALKEFWQGNIPGISSPEDLLEPNTIIQFGRPPHRLDLLNRIDGVQFQQAWPSRVTARLPGSDEEIPVYFIDLPTLLLNKKASGRPKDLADIAALKPL